MRLGASWVPGPALPASWHALACSGMLWRALAYSGVPVGAELWLFCTSTVPFRLQPNGRTPGAVPHIMGPFGMRGSAADMLRYAVCKGTQGQPSGPLCMSSCHCRLLLPDAYYV